MYGLSAKGLAGYRRTLEERDVAQPGLERLLWEQEAGSSNLPVPIVQTGRK